MALVSIYDAETNLSKDTSPISDMQEESVIVRNWNPITHDPTYKNRSCPRFGAVKGQLPVMLSLGE